MAKIDETRENMLMTLNLGDSGYLILRPDVNTPRDLFLQVHRSKDQLYSFNYPYQVGNMEEKGGFSKKDNGELAYENEHVI